MTHRKRKSCRLPKNENIFILPIGEYFCSIFAIYNTRIFGALTGPKILAGTAPIKVGSARLVLVDLVACFEFLSAAVTQQRLYQICDGKT